MQLYRSLNPSTGELLEEFRNESASRIEIALDFAAERSRVRRSQSIEERSALIRRVAERMESRREECARLMTLEMGKPIGQADIEAGRCIDVCRFFAEQGPELLEAEQRPASDGRATVRFDPLGTVFAIMPWNFPFWQVFRCAAPALMAGNTVLLKHAPNTPQCGRIIESIFREAGAEEGTLQNLFLTDEQAASVIRDRRVAAVSLTGSVRAGRAVGKVAGESLKRCVLELGGSDPFIVCADADLTRTVNAAVDFRCLNNGQSCISPKRIFVERSVSAEFTEAFFAGMKGRIVGDPLDPKTQNGPMARSDLRDQLLDQIARSVSGGAKLLGGGERGNGPGFFVSPGVIADANRQNVARREEIFGPIGVVVPFDGEDELLELANDSEFGLGASVWTSDRERAMRIAEKIEAGVIFINGAVRSDPRLPFGGVKDSGIGRELGREGMREFVNIKAICEV